ncbi:MAG: helix-turn-helix domain-containing protein [bacterium]|nr:helix-turn-helix domain-containing protein [bacterium]
MASKRDTSPNPGSCLPSPRRDQKRPGATLEQIAETTKINIRFLRAIESGRFEQLPGGIFRTSYIRQYARATGLDPEELLARCRNRIGDKASEIPLPAANGSSHKRTAMDWIRVFKL